MLKITHILVKAEERNLSVSYHESYESAYEKMKNDICSIMEIESTDEFDIDDFDGGIYKDSAWCTADVNYDWVIEELPNQND